MTLAIGRSARRAREVGLRKAVGAQRSQLMYQFWSEAFLMSIGALGIGLLFSRLALPLFNQMTGKALAFSLLESHPAAAGLVGADSDPVAEPEAEQVRVEGGRLLVGRGRKHHVLSHRPEAQAALLGLVAPLSYNFV